MSDEFLQLSDVVPGARPDSAEAVADPTAPGAVSAQVEPLVEPLIESIDRELDSVTTLDASLAEFDTVVGETKPGETHGGANGENGEKRENREGGRGQKVEGSDADAEDVATDRGPLQVRTMEIPVWLSTKEVTTFLVGAGRKKTLEEEYECTVAIAGRGSGTKDPAAPGFDLPHLLVTMSGHDVRLIGRLRRALEDSLIDYVVQNSAEQEDKRTPPPSVGRLLYALALSAADASPNTRDRTPGRTVPARSHYPFYLHTNRRDGEGDDRRRRGPLPKQVWMNAVELPRDDEAQEYHGRFLVGRNGRRLEYYRTKFLCQVEVYGVWGDEDDLMCAPYVLVTSEEGKHNVDRCLQFIEHRIREHEEKYGASREGGRRILKGETE